MITITNQSNYLAQIVVLENEVPIESANNLTSWKVNNQVVVTDKKYQKGDVCVLVQPGTRIDHQFLSTLNMYSNTTLNVNPDKKGYMEKSGVVKAVKFNKFKVISEGLLLKVESLIEVYGEFDYAKDQFFDTVNGFVVFEKYERPSTLKTTTKNVVTKIKNFNKFHYDTEKLINNFDAVSGRLVVTRKLHGTSAVFGSMKVEKQFNWFEKIILNWMKISLETLRIYKRFYCSRKVLKYFEGELSVKNHFYNTDVWGEAFQKIKHCIEDGITIYAEIVGPNIQKGYDYGAKDFDIYVYRITLNDVEFSWEAIKDYCKKYSLKTVPEYEIISYETDFADNQFPEVGFHRLIEYLRENYLEKMAEDCKVPVPDEGVCVLANGKWYKLKSVLFLSNEYEESAIVSGSTNSISEE